MSSRKIQSRARVLALQALYAEEQQSLPRIQKRGRAVGGADTELANVAGDSAAPTQRRYRPDQFCDVLEFSWLDRQASDEELFMARALVGGVRENSAEIEELIAGKLQNWSMDRLLAVDRNVLRLGCYMLKYLSDTPIKVIIDECIELCHSFSSDQSYCLVNGVLHNLAQQLRPEQLPDTTETQ